MMSGLSYPVVVEELFQLTALGIQPYDISFTTLTLNGDKYICVRELLKVSEDIVIVDVAHPGRCLRFPTKAEAAIVHPRCRIVALRAGTMVQVFNIDLKSRLCHLRMQQPVLFWKWISETVIVLVTQTTVFHWSIEGNHELVQVFERAITEDVQVVNYLQDSSGKWSALVTISYKDKVAGHIQLYSLETKENYFFEGSVAAFADFSAPSQNNESSTFFCYAAATDNGIRVVIQPLDATGVNKEKKLSHELPTKVPSRAASPSPLSNSNNASHSPSGTSPPDFPVSMQYSERYGFIFLVSKVGQFFLLSLDSMFLSNELFFYECLLPETLFVSSFHSSTSGLLGVSQKGKVFLITVNESAIVPFIAQFGGEEVAFAVANRASIPWSFHSQIADEPAEGDILSLISSNLRQMELQEQHHAGGNSPSMWSQKHLSAKQLHKNSPLTNHRLSPGPPSPPMTYSPHPFSPHPLNLQSSGSFGLPGTGENQKSSLLSQLQQNSIPYTPPAHPQPGNMPSPISPYPRSRSPSPAPRLFTEVSCYQIMKDFSTACVSNNPRYNNGLVALAAHSGNIIVFGLVDEKVMCSITPVESPILALCFCPTREWLCAASPRSILIYSIETRELIEQIKLKPTVTEGGHLVPPCCAVLQWDFSGSVLYAIFNDKKILRWTF